MKKANAAAKWAKAKTKNARSRNGSNGEAFHVVERWIARKSWSKARAAIQELLVYHPADHWLWMHLGATYYEQKQYDKALKCCEHAVQLQPDCPLVLWHYAGALHMAGRSSAALSIWTNILNQDVETIAYGEHGEGMDWALQLVNDVHFRMARCYQHLGNLELAKQSYEKYLHNRRHGVRSLYGSSMYGSSVARQQLDIINRELLRRNAMLI